jgi:hypothetical protein
MSSGVQICDRRVSGFPVMLEAGTWWYHLSRTELLSSKPLHILVSNPTPLSTQALLLFPHLIPPKLLFLSLSSLYRYWVTGALGGCWIIKITPNTWGKGLNSALINPVTKGTHMIGPYRLVKILCLTQAGWHTPVIPSAQEPVRKITILCLHGLKYW